MLIERFKSYGKTFSSFCFLWGMFWCWCLSKSKLLLVKLKRMKLGKEKFSSGQLWSSASEYISYGQQKIMLMDSFKSCPAVEKVLLMGIFMSHMLFVYMINLLVQMLQAIQKQTSLSEAYENVFRSLERNSLLLNNLKLKYQSNQHTFKGEELTGIWSLLPPRIMWWNSPSLLHFC